jgi:hypothetical protein
LFPSDTQVVHAFLQIGEDLDHPLDLSSRSSLVLRFSIVRRFGRCVTDEVVCQHLLQHLGASGRHAFDEAANDGFAVGELVFERDPHIGKRPEQHREFLLHPLATGWDVRELLVIDEVLCEVGIERIQPPLLERLFDDSPSERFVLLG